MTVVAIMVSSHLWLSLRTLTMAKCQHDELFKLSWPQLSRHEDAAPSQAQRFWMPSLEK